MYESDPHARLLATVASRLFKYNPEGVCISVEIMVL
jgi:hypothetical protein